MKLYDCAMAPNPRRVRIFLAEKKVEVEVRQINILEGENLSDEYLAINRWGFVPALELEDGTCLSEAPCIFRYIEHIYPEPNLLGKTPIETAEIGKWERFSEMQGGQAIGEFFRNQAEPLKNRGLPGFSDLPQIPELISRGKKRAEWFYAQINMRLMETEFIAGERFTAADITTLCVIDFGKRVGLPFSEQQTPISQWYEKITARKSTSF
tara:strand:- start:303 stop:932 length:630 start_codon:yes stop_codon:yes gene_type:complete